MNNENQTTAAETRREFLAGAAARIGCSSLSPDSVKALITILGNCNQTQRAGQPGLTLDGLGEIQGWDIGRDTRRLDEALAPLFSGDYISVTKGHDLDNDLLVHPAPDLIPEDQAGRLAFRPMDLVDFIPVPARASAGPRHIVKDTVVERLTGPAAEDRNIWTTMKAAYALATEDARENMKRVVEGLAGFKDEIEADPVGFDLTNPDLLRMIARAEEARRDLHRLTMTCRDCGAYGPGVDILKHGIAENEGELEAVRKDAPPRCVGCSIAYLSGEVAGGLDVVIDEAKSNKERGMNAARAESASTILAHIFHRLHVEDIEDGETEG